MKSIKVVMMTLFTILSIGLFAQQKTSSETKQTKIKTSQVKYACPMHPEETAVQPGKCSKCKMDLTEVKQYSCPMHADITSDKPGKCSKCKMDLVEKKDDHSGHHH
jgi:Heavy metal binding domain